MLDNLSDKIVFAEILNTRFCHDMAGPISAINNGLEFLLDVENEDMKAQAADLLTFSAKEALVKLQTYRMIYGRANKQARSKVLEVKTILSNFFGHTKINLEWPEEDAKGKNINFGEDITNEDRRILVSMVNIVAGALVYGGTISASKVNFQEKDGFLICVSGYNDEIKNDSKIMEILNGNIPSNEDLSPHNIQASFLVNLAKSENIELSYCISEDESGGKIKFTAYIEQKIK